MSETKTVYAARFWRDDTLVVEEATATFTPRQVTLDRYLSAFHNRLRHPVDHQFYFSPADAVAALLRRTERELVALQKEVEVTEAQIATLKEWKPGDETVVRSEKGTIRGPITRDML